MKKANDEFEESVDRWFKFVEEYNKESTVPLSYAMLPNTKKPPNRDGGFTDYKYKRLF